jgi:rhodanese-related sulfurtransferase
MGEVIAHIKKIPKHKDVVFYCEKGIRSTIIIQRLEGYGYYNIFSLTGGMSAWHED